MSPRILLVENNAELAAGIRHNLELEGYDTIWKVGYRFGERTKRMKGKVSTNGRTPFPGSRRRMASLRRVAVGAAIAVPALVALAWAMRPGGNDDELPVLWRAPDFALVDQAGDTLRAFDLRGTTWVTSFVFTNCARVCPLITARMAELRDSLGADGLLGAEVRLISITVDPARDTVAALAEYAKRFGDSPASDWAFLTGSPPEAVRALVEEGFKVGAYLDPEAADTAASYQVTHGGRFELVDAEGRVRATYDATDPGAVERVLSDLRRVLE